MQKRCSDRLVWYANLSGRASYPGHAAGNLAFLQVIPKSPTSFGTRHFLYAPMLLHLLHHPAAIAVYPYLEAAIPVHGQSKLCELKNFTMSECLLHPYDRLL